MKKVLSVLAVSALVFGFSSCSKSGTCTCDLGPLGSTSVEYEDLDNDEYDEVKDACTTGGICTWEDN
mgnify:CR=1 FL=1